MFSKTTEMDSEDVVPASDSDDFSIQVDSDIIMNIKESCRTKKGAFALRNYFRGCKWSPDGSCLLTANADNRLRIYDLPSKFLTASEDHQEKTIMTPSLEVQASDLIYDMAWFPLMTSTSAEYSVFLVSCGRNTIQLIDAYTGKTRATYKAFDHLEQLVSPHSIAFSPDGEKIYAGYNGLLRVFYTSSPGSCFIEVRTQSEDFLQRGILSCISFNPVDAKMFAVGSYSKQISLSNEPDDLVFHVLEGQKGGVTHVAFSSDGTKLFSGGRKDPEILCWDLRNLGKVLSVYTRSVNTNQTMYFDVSHDVLCTGNDNGLISFWKHESEKISPLSASHCSQTSSPQGSATQSYLKRHHDDSVNGICLHPSLPLLASCSGSRKFPQFTSDDEDERIFSRDIKSSTQGDNNSLKIWQIDRQTSSSLE